jgi:hypothetical protein
VPSIDPWSEETWSEEPAPPRQRFGTGCLVALIVSMIGLTLAAILVLRALDAASSGVSL